MCAYFPFSLSISAICLPVFFLLLPPPLQLLLLLLLLLLLPPLSLLPLVLVLVQLMLLSPPLLQLLPQPLLLLLPVLAKTSVSLTFSYALYVLYILPLCRWRVLGRNSSISISLHVPSPLLLLPLLVKVAFERLSLTYTNHPLLNQKK